MSDQDDPIPRGRIRRAMPLAGFTARAAGGRIVAGILERAGDNGALERFHERTADRYVELLGHAKGALMKVGQIISMVDARAVGTGGFWPYQQALMQLQSDAPPMDTALVREIVRTDLGSAVGLFAEFDDEPMAAASIGQVHRAVLCDGRQAVVKIQYPGVAQAIKEDLANTELVTTLMRFAMSAAGLAPDFRAVAREVTARIIEEVDYRHEAATIATFSQLYRGHPFICIPDVVAEGCGDRVLTMTYLDGMDWEQAQHADQDLKNAWAEVIMRFSYGNHRHANLLHADPHPGNYLFGADGTVGFVDFGCVKILPEGPRRAWVETIRAVIEGRPNDIRDRMVQLGFLNDGSSITADELYQWWSELIYETVVMPQPATFTPETTRRYVRTVVDIRSADHLLARMEVPEDFVFISRVQLAITNICSTLRATLPVRAISDDLDGAAEPITELGKLHHAWVRERGLPSALDRHDHP